MKEKKNLALSGGGIKGITHLGALYALDKLDILQNITHFSGTSVGSLIIGLHVIGYSPLELYEFIKVFNFDELKNMDINNINNFGFDTGTKMEYVIRRLITNKGFNNNITLQEIFNKTGKHITLTTVCVNTMTLCLLSHDLWPDLELAKAIMMSITIPLIFCPVIYNNNMYVDGACLDNFPVNVFGDMEETIGLIITESNDRVDINDLETYMIRVFKCIANSSNNNHKHFEKCTIQINADIIGAVDFDINDQLKDQLFLIGYDAIVNNLEKLV